MKTEIKKKALLLVVLGRVNATITHDPCSQTICQNAFVVLGMGPCVAIYLHFGLESNYIYMDLYDNTMMRYSW